MSDCLFCKIVAGEIPAEKVGESELSLAFNDIQPQAPVHVLVIPKKHHTGIADMNDAQEIGDMVLLANKIAVEKNLASGYRLVINQGLDGGQSVFHTHIHLLGERKLSWPPG